MKKLERWLLLLGLLYFTAGQAQVYHPILIDDRDEWAPAHHVYYVSSPVLLTPEQAFARVESGQAPVLTQNRFKMGFHPDYFWFYLRLKSVGKPKTVVLKVDRPDLHHVQCFRKEGGRIDTLAMTGDAVPFTARPILVNGFAIPVELDAGQEVELLLLVEKRNESISSKLALYEINRFWQIKRYEFGIYATYLGIVIFLLLFHFFLWLSMRDTAHLFFIGQLISSCFYLSGSAGFLNEWPLLDLPYKLSTITSAMIFCWTGFCFFFINSFLKLSRSNSWFYRLNRGFGYLNFVLAFAWILGTFVKEYPLSPGYIKVHVTLMELVFSLNLLIFIGALVEQNIRRNPMARVYGLAVSFLALGFALNLLDRNSSLSLHPYLSRFGRNFSWIVPGIFFEQIALAFGLTIRYSLLNRKNTDLKISLSKAKSEIAEKVIHTQETERRRLAKDLHDDLGGTLSTIKGQAASENASLQTLNLIEKAIEDLRNVSRNLMPPELEEAGLAGAVHQAVERLQNVSQTEFIFITFGREVRLGADTELNIYRIIGELLNNILKHAKASKAVVQLLYYNDHLLVSVEDNGVGIKAGHENRGLGLKNINSRVEYLKATFSVDTGPYGTTVMVGVPYQGVVL